MKEADPILATAETNHDGARSALLDLLAKLHLTLGKVEEKLTADQRRRREFSQNIIPLTVELTDVTTSGTTDRPNILGPRTGWYWDIHTIVADVTAGSIAGYLNNTNGMQVFNFTTSGQLNFGTLQCFLSPGERLIYVGSSSLPAAGASISIRGLQIAAPYFGEYAI